MSKNYDGIKNLSNKINKNITKNSANERLRKLRNNLIQEWNYCKNDQKKIDLIKSSTEIKNNASQRLQKFRNKLITKPAENRNALKRSHTKVDIERPMKRQHTDTNTNECSTSTKAFKFTLQSEPDYNFTSPKTDHRDTGTEMETMDWSNDSDAFHSNTNHSTELYLLVDTNIFIAKLDLIKTIINMNIGDSRLIIYIPWMVLEELDFIKSNQKLSQKKFDAIDAINFINQQLALKNDRIICQTISEALQQKNCGSSPDNKIIATILQIAEKKDVLFLSDDVNLRNKAMANTFESCSSFEILRILNERLGLCNKTERMMNAMSKLLTFVLKECAKNTYGIIWNKMETFKKLPQTLFESIILFMKCWKTVLSGVLLKQSLKTVEELQNYLKNTDALDDEKLWEYCLKICFYLNDIESCRNRVQKTILLLNDIKSA